MQLIETCSTCKGDRTVALQWPDDLEFDPPVDRRECRVCHGTGRVFTEEGRAVLRVMKLSEEYAQASHVGAERTNLGY